MSVFNTAAGHADFNFVVPNECEDAHDNCQPQKTAIAQFDTFLSNEVPAIQTFDPGAMIIITFDEGTSNKGPSNSKQFAGGGNVVFLAIGPGVSANHTDSTPSNHYGLLRTLEACYGLGRSAERPLDTTRRRRSAGSARNGESGCAPGRAPRAHRPFLSAHSLPRRDSGRTPRARPSQKASALVQPSRRSYALRTWSSRRPRSSLTIASPPPAGSPRRMNGWIFSSRSTIRCRAGGALIGSAGIAVSGDRGRARLDGGVAGRAGGPDRPRCRD